MNELLALSATAQARMIREKKISSKELIDAHLAQIAKVNPAINAVVEVLEPKPNGPEEGSGPLAGVPFSVKDSIEIKRRRCTAGTIGRRNAPPARVDATVVERLREAGAIPIARTNLPDLLFAFETDNLLFGRTNNPYDLSRTPGGSSGGEAALIASCGSPFGLGSDCAGSVRVPAAFCGIASIKPTSGRIPRTGHFPPAGGWIEALWQIGPMARHVEDLCTVLPLLIGGDDHLDFTTVGMPLGDPRQVPLRDLRVALHYGDGAAAADADVTRTVIAAAKALGQNREVKYVVPGPTPCLDQVYELEMKLLGADGGDSLWQYLEQLGSTEVHPLLKAWLDKLEPYRTDVAGLQKYWAEWDQYRAPKFDLHQFDAILCPVYTHAALPHGASVIDAHFRGFANTMAYNLSGWPAAVVRCGETADGLPIGVQIVARPWREDVALAIALRLEEALGGWKPPKLIESL